MSIELKNINFSYDGETNILNDISFKVEQGEYLCIIGHNGSGKSTLSKIISGLVLPDEGEVIINGKTLVETDDFDDLRTDLSIVFQNPDSQFVGSTVEDDIAFGLENSNVDPKEMPDIINKYASIVGMDKFLKKEPHNLSGGQKQRVAIAAALATKPNIIIFDETTSMLDPLGKYQVKQLMKEIGDDKRFTIISITHDMDELIQCDKVLVLNHGQVMYHDTPMNVFKHKDELLKMDLDIPFNLKVSLMLKDKGLKPTLDRKELINSLCKLK